MIPFVAGWRESELGLFSGQSQNPKLKLQWTTVWPGSAYATLQGWAG